MANLRAKDVCSPGFLASVGEHFTAAKGFMAFLCEAIDVPF